MQRKISEERKREVKKKVLCFLEVRLKSKERLYAKTWHRLSEKNITNKIEKK